MTQFNKISNFKSGFSLIELLITLAIISVLAAIIYPSYNFYIVKIRRSNVSAIMLEVATRLEQYYVKNNKYDGATLSNLAVDDSSYKDYYQINISAQTNSYFLQATPIGAQAKSDQQCKVLGLDQNGNKTITGESDVEYCWGAG